jgi:hypothetical protein
MFLLLDGHADRILRPARGPFHRCRFATTIGGRDMRWVLHGEHLTTAAADALRRHGHDPRQIAELALAQADGFTPTDFFKAAQSKQLDVFTTDAALVNAIFDEKIPFNRAVVFLQLEGGDVEQDDAIDRLFKRYKRLSPGRLYTVTGSRVKIRQLPTKK